MNSEVFFRSFGGVLAVIGAFAVPIVAIAIIGALLLKLTQKRHLERMKMIETGMAVPEPKTKRKQWYGLLISGAVLLAFGLALLVGQLASGHSDDLEGPCIFTFVGMALLGCFAFIRRNQRSQDASPEPPRPS